jgi:hypothetical protein
MPSMSNVARDTVNEAKRPYTILGLAIGTGFLFGACWPRSSQWARS